MFGALGLNDRDSQLKVLNDFCVYYEGDSNSCDGCPIGRLCDETEGIFSSCTDNGKIELAYRIVLGNSANRRFDQDMINHPSHYCHGMECVDEIELIFGKEVLKHFCLGNAWKYRKRALFKNGQEDIDKSDFYINKYKELCQDDSLEEVKIGGSNNDDYEERNQESEPFFGME